VGLTVGAAVNGYVTWKSLTTIGLTIVGLVFGVMGWTWQVHTAQPHPTSVSQKEFDRHLLTVGQRLQSIEAKLDKLITERK